MSLLGDVKDIKIKVNIIHETLLGDPRDQNKPGALMRLDRVEQSLKSWKTIFWILVPVAITIIATVAARAFYG